MTHDFSTSQKQVLSEVILAFADDELVLGHRISEWCGHAPILEEDIAFANLALDEIGHALLYYQLFALFQGEDPERYPDQLVYFREPFEFRASHFVCLPNGDWAFSMLRQYLWDTLEYIRLGALTESGFAPLAETAAKIRTEEIYHLHHTRAWVKRLGLGTGESNRRMQVALDTLWPYTEQLFKPTGLGSGLVERGVLPDPDRLRESWEKDVRELFEMSGLKVPEKPQRTLDRAIQSQYLVEILAGLQIVARSDPDAIW